MSLFVANEKPDSDSDSFLKAVTCVWFFHLLHFYIFARFVTSAIQELERFHRKTNRCFTGHLLNAGGEIVVLILFFLFCQGVDLVAATSGLIVDTFRCDDYETSATLLVNAAIALSITTLVLTKDDMHM
jgi:hypothetical protein